jgi:branched-subunit amino acid transport protein
VSGQAVGLVAGCAVITAVIKAIGPVAFGGRPLPPAVASVVGLLAPPLLAALVVTQALADGTHLTVDATTAGVALAGLAAWLGAPVVVCVVLAAAVSGVGAAVT